MLAIKGYVPVGVILNSVSTTNSYVVKKLVIWGLIALLGTACTFEFKHEKSLLCFVNQSDKFILSSWNGWVIVNLLKFILW